MRIAQIAPLYESTPPQFYGGTERVVSYLTEEFVKQGHDVTLFASGDSITNAKLIKGSPKALRLDIGCIDPLAHHFVMLQKVFEMADQFDVLHFHIDYLHFPFSIRSDYCHITTLHGRLDLPDLQPLYSTFDKVPVVSISNHQRKPLLQANWVDTVYHGIPHDLYSLNSGEGHYLAFLGRVSPEKRLDKAIEIAKAVGMRLKIAAKIDKVDIEYFNHHIRHMLDHPLIEFIGEIGETEKKIFLGNAAALLFPIDWPEPFGMVMIEAMANGTPIIAFNKGSVPEIIDHGVTGFIVSNEQEAIEAVYNLPLIDRAECRRVFEHRFGADVMARNYIKVYERVAEDHCTQKNRARKTSIKEII
ncbi:glycosyltransferase family 4 protein [Solitalea sp. MAHUQ-68]|uniref:Glycosyltransferase family 4 protein n=1 Tax=Solitalea agri TaxID=2953739 RepID=A0A9X2F4I4_9SPHI|nr:glycosyltransferase family 4 protein [Solitalea agri]MCO4294644.1 glycosyltransferase family 4 protein [Solitalea agri]